MAGVKTAAELGTDQVKWDLTAFYGAPDSAAVQGDLEKLAGLLAAFERDFKGRLGSRLGEAIGAYGTIVKLMVKLQAYFELTLARETDNTAARKEASRVQETVAAAQGKHLTFFELEIAKLGEAELAAQLAHVAVAKHMPWIIQVRRLAEHYLEEGVERSLVLRAPYGPGEWADMMHELETGLRFELDGAVLTLPEVLNIVSEARDGDKRARALEVLNAGLEKHIYFTVRTLNVTAGNNLADNDARGFGHPMQATNLGNMVDDATVDVLHEVVADKGVALARRYYKLKAKLLGLETLKWSDRNAPMPFAAERTLDWKESCAMVKAAYGAFSGTLGELVATVLEPRNGWVDAAPGKAKIAGAFDYTVVTPEGVRSYMLLNHLGGVNDVMTLAHELGHAVHGLLAAEAQGPVMWHAPMPYAETASIFGEMLTFESLLRTTTDRQELLALYMDKMTDFMNTVVRQICFSEFEQAIYAKRRGGKLSADDLDRLWMDVTKQFYGEDGDVFTYEHTAHLWGYVSHFYSYRPFYVYAYAFGELFTQSLMATRSEVGARFEPLYLDLLRAGGTKDAVALMAPFGLDPNRREFWEKGIAASAGVWIGKAERLVEELGL